jgi:hypothetical protein
MGETNDCTVKALSVVAGIPYDQAHRELKALGRRSGKGFSMSRFLYAVRKHKETRRLNQREFMAQHYEHAHVGQSVTPSHPVRFAAYWPKGTFIMETRGHVLAVKDGEVCDWSEGRALRCLNLYQVL